ncbi:unnamed protein product [Notodromas monacha]|uniref:Nuclear pore complex protein Nup85 n=1 Tax=Notodromas monacha TaxID=399045 RepID=A0A7R9BXY3_9CRUS|nr:unnamed protein product [Notodromas monacha]CAG0922870.1 unnamed protein product [Notodromas monacha]
MESVFNYHDSQLLCGNLAEVEDVLLRFPMHIDWYELLPAVLLFDFTSRPTVEDVPNAVEMCLRLCRMGERGTELRPVDLILISFAKLNRKKGIDQSAAGFNNCWFLAHWTDLMYRAGTLGFMDEKDAKRYRQQFVLDYALQLIDENLSNMSSAHFWTIAMNYLDKSDQYSRRMLENRLLRLPLQNERAVLRLLQISQQEGMQEVALTLCRVKCRESASKGQYYAAILWAMRCGEASTIALATREFVRALVQESSRENLTSLDKIDIPAAWTAVSPDLAFLANYREFCFYKRQMKHADALNVLVNMMKSSHVPSLFRPILNSDAVMLMNEESARFTVEDIESIMRYVDKSGQMRQQQKHGSCGASLATVRKTLLKKYETLADSS